MRAPRFPLLVAVASALAGCAAADAPPVLPGTVNAPPPPMAAAGGALLTGTVWRWTGTVMSNDTRITPDAPERYTLEFQPGGMVAVRADCNRGSGSYLLNGGALTFGPLAMTRATRRSTGWLSAPVTTAHAVWMDARSADVIS